MSKKQGFVLYKDMQTDVEDLNLEQKGMLFDCIFNYQNDVDFETEDKFVNFVMKQYIKIFERDKKKYEETCEKRKKAIEKRWAKKNEEQQTNNDVDNPSQKQIEFAKRCNISTANKTKNELSFEIEEAVKRKKTTSYSEPIYGAKFIGDVSLDKEDFNNF